MKKYYIVGLSLVVLSGCSLLTTPPTPEPVVDVGDDVIEDVATTCPVNGPFEVGVDSDDRYCTCPAGYEKDSDVIGYEICYGDAECPILEVECVKTVDTTVEDTTIEVGPTEDDLEALVDDGQLYNEDYGYVIEVGEEHVDNMTEVAITPFDGVTATYVYCYDTTESDLASFDCPGTAAETFRINVYTSDQYEAIADGPGAGTVITEVAGYVYELTHPNGFLPEDVPADDDFYETVVTSFNFAG